MKRPLLCSALPVLPDAFPAVQFPAAFDTGTGTGGRPHGSGPGSPRDG